MSKWRVQLAQGADIAGFRAAVRALLAAGAKPNEVLWTASTPDLFGEPSSDLPIDAPAISLPRAVGELAERVICHREPERYGLLYQLIWRARRGERTLLEAASEPLVARLMLMSKAVRRDLHKMHAFLRFRVVVDPDLGERFIAWFEPDHFILDAAAPFFLERFTSLHWSILTPIGSLYWDRKQLFRGAPAKRGDAPDIDPFEAGWLSYYQSTFNPARANPDLLQQHMPKKYWRNLPEAQAIPAMVRSAGSRVDQMIEQEAAITMKRTPAKALAARLEQGPHSLKELNQLIADAGPLVQGATKAVLGEGPLEAMIAFVGEQPGDQEDTEGRPFVGPAGKLLSRAMGEAGIERDKAYVTNAVKHFKFELRGKRRLHQSPTTAEIKHYRWWLEKELEFVDPKVVVALGATAVHALAGKALPITRNRGPYEWGEDFGKREGYITVHPSYLLRIPDQRAKEEAYDAFVTDLKRIRMLAEGVGQGQRRLVAGG